MSLTKAVRDMMSPGHLSCVSRNLSNFYLTIELVLITESSFTNASLLPLTDILIARPVGLTLSVLVFSGLWFSVTSFISITRSFPSFLI